MNDYWDDEEQEEEEEIQPQPIRRRRAQNNERRGNLYLLTGLVMGLVMGLVYTWLVSPVRYLDTEPASLAAPFKDEYRRLIALAYSADHNLGRARERLALLDMGNPVQVLASQAQRMIAENQPAQEARALALLANDLGKSVSMLPTSLPGVGISTEVVSTAVEATSSLEPTRFSTNEIGSAVQTPTIPPPAHTPTITYTPQPTFTPRPTSIPVQVLDAPFKLENKREVCKGNIEPGLLQIQVIDKNGKPLSGIPILVTWQGGENEFYTGLAPEKGPGYADFAMESGVTYSLQVGTLSKVISGITIPSCNGNWSMEFREGN
jgi:hypothetical protein